ncbi:LPXTG cell wall anchor domain-containing protein [Arthrobacter sp. NPDC093139]|uniref:LPXTG cell wall anchor domain-containing protein n=1 Tax=Arthrobacter sp. NPDC093139 TaxID=3363945 RepID=UPI00381FDD6A
MGRVHFRSPALAAAVLLLLLSGAGTAAAADPVLPVPETGGEAMLRLTSSVYPLDIPHLTAGQSFSWQVGVVLDGPEDASATVEVQATGSLAAGPDAYRITARSCPVQWQGTSGKDAAMSCPAEERRILAAESFSAAGTLSYPLGSFTAADEPWVLFTLEGPRSAGLSAGTLKFGIGVVAGGDESSRHPLARTGAEVLGYMGAGIALVAAGAGLLLARRRRLS